MALVFDVDLAPRGIIVTYKGGRTDLRPYSIVTYRKLLKECLDNHRNSIRDSERIGTTLYAELQRIGV